MTSTVFASATTTTGPVRSEYGDVDSLRPSELGNAAMMGERTVQQEALFYGFRLEDHVPVDHLLRSVDRLLAEDKCSITEPLRQVGRIE